MIQTRIKPSILIAAVVVLLCVIWSIAFASTTGIVSGVIKDSATGAKLPGVNVVIKGTNLTTVTDANGYYVITNVPPGNYTVEANLVGYSVISEEDVEVVMDVTSSIDFDLSQEVTEEKEVALTEKKRLVQPDVTPTLYIVDYKQEQQVKSQPNNLYQIPGIVTTQPGVTPDADGRPHIRGGRDTQVGYMVDGIPVVEPLTGVFATNTVTVGMSKLQIYTGGYRAEYGNAISGILNEIKKTGSEVAGGSMEMTGGAQDYKGAYLEYGDTAPNGLDYYVGTYNWSSQFENMFFSGTDSSDTVGKFVYPLDEKNRLTFLINQGTARYALDYSHSRTYRPGVGIVNVTAEEDHGHQGYRILGLTWAHNFSPSSFITVRPYQVKSWALIDTLSQGDDAPMGPNGQWLNWYSNQRGLQLEYTNQVSQNQLVKAGTSIIDSNNLYHAYIPDGYMMYGVDESYGDYHYTAPASTIQTSTFVQDQIKFGDWTAEAGLRQDRMRFDKKANPDVANDQISPRLGLTYNSDKKSVWRASWGSFIQFAPSYVMERLYVNPIWNEYRNGSIGLNPERSKSFDFGYERQVDDDTMFRITPFYRSYSDLIQSMTISGVRNYVNSGEGKSYGLEGYFSKKFSDNWDVWASYTYLKARANASSFTSTIDPTIKAYTDWDQRHTIAAVANYNHKDWSHSIMMNYGSGYADSVMAMTAPFQGRSGSNLIFSWNITKQLPKTSWLGDSISLNIYNIFDVDKATHRSVYPAEDDEGNLIGIPEDDMWTMPRFITLGVTRRF